MKTVNVHEAKTHLSRLLAQVARGEEIIIAKSGKPIARLVPVSSAGHPRPLGMDSDRAFIGQDFDAPLPEDIVAGFET